MDGYFLIGHLLDSYRSLTLFQILTKLFQLVSVAFDVSVKKLGLGSY